MIHNLCWYNLYGFWICVDDTIICMMDNWYNNADHAMILG